MTFNMPGLQKAISTQAEACSPAVSENISTINPQTNDATNNNHLGVSNGTEE